MAEEKEEEKKKPEGILVIKGSDEKVERLVRGGGIEAIFYIESHGSDKSSVGDALKNTILNDLKSEEHVEVRAIKFHPVLEKDEFYSGFVECTFAARDFRSLIYLATRYGPAAIEIVHPDSITLNKGEVQALLADVSASVQGLTAKIMELMSPELRTKVLKEGLDL